MSSQLKPIRDPNDSKAKINELPTKMKMRDVKTCEPSKNADGKPVYVRNLANQVPEDKVKGLDPICSSDKTFECSKIAEKVIESIESIDAHKGFIIGRTPPKIYCGHTIQTVKTGSYARIGSGKSVLHEKPPILVQKKAKNQFKYDQDRQLAIKVGNTPGKDWVVVVASNGCIFLDNDSYAAFNLPVFIVEESGNYYKIDSGNRLLEFGTGTHLILYTKEAPILFFRGQPISQKSSGLTSKSISSVPLQMDSTVSNEPLEQMAKENKGLIKDVVPFKSDSLNTEETEPVTRNLSKQQMSTEEQTKKEELPKKATENRAVEAVPDDQDSNWQRYVIIGAIVLVLLPFVYLFIGKKSKNL